MDENADEARPILDEERNKKPYMRPIERLKNLLKFFNHGLIYGIATGTVNATTALSAKYLAMFLIPAKIHCYRSGIQLPIFALLMFIFKVPLRVEKKEKWYLLCRAICFGAHSLLVYMSFSRISLVELFVILYGSNSTTSLFISKLLIKRPISCLTFFSLILVTGGICTTCIPTVIFDETRKTRTYVTYIEGYSLAALSGITLSISGALNKYLKLTSVLAIGFYNTLCNLLLSSMLLMADFSNIVSFSLSPILISYVVANALLSLLNTLVYTMATQRGNIVDVALGMQADIPVGTFLDHFWYDVPLTVYSICGSIITLIGLSMPLAQLKIQQTLESNSNSNTS